MSNFPTPPILQAEKLIKTFTEGKTKISVLNEVDLFAEKGEMIAIVGASGSGKTTFLQLLGGLDKPSSGRVLIAGQDLAKLNEKEKGRLRNQYLGFVYQFHHLLPEFNALENVCLPLLIRGTQPKLAQEAALHYIEHVGLTDRKTHRVGELSGGERQRIAIARALVTESHCVLADEPTGNLDEKTAMHIVDLLLQLNANLGIAFIIVTHNINLARKMQRILVMEEGKLKIKE